MSDTRCEAGIFELFRSSKAMLQVAVHAMPEYIEDKTLKKKAVIGEIGTSEMGNGILLGL